MENHNGNLTRADEIATDPTPGAIELRDPTAANDPGTALKRVAERAEQVRRELGYKGRMTAKLFNQLSPLLAEVPSPGVAQGSAEKDGGFEHLLFQRSVMDAVLLPTHWTALTHYESRGLVARAWVVVGNGVAGLKLDESTGALNPCSQAIVKAYESWGGWQGAQSPPDQLKGSRTNVLRLLLAEVGPGRDAFKRIPGSPDWRPRYTPDLTAIAGPGEAKAEDVEVKALLKVIRERGLPAGQVASLICRAAGAPEIPFAEEHEAQAFVDERLDDRRIVLPAGLVPVLSRLLREATPADPTPPSTSTPLSDRETSRGGADDTVPFEPGSARAA